ncbi:hypothetical protein [Carnobacterium mobile]|uniref:hypothetical protein n=1 Tax=Carnobacterium mobile TaxID=2750 RepID=UPI000553B734|nr:hypothetical protein [Carnobacterium mobile]
MKNKKLLKKKEKVRSIYIHKDGVLSHVTVGEQGVISIKLDKWSALIKMDNGQKLIIDQVEGVAIEDNKGIISTFVKNKMGKLKKIRNEEKYEKNSK